MGLEESALYGDASLLNADMTGTAHGYQVSQLVRFFILFGAKRTKWGYVVNVKSAVKFRFMNSATLTFVLVALARFFSLLYPIRAAVIRLAALPIWAVGARTVFGNPDALAFVAAKLPFPVPNVADRVGVCLAADRASTINAVIRSVRVVFADPVLRLPLPHARARAEVLFGVVALRRSFAKGCAAMSAKNLDRDASVATIEDIRTWFATEFHSAFVSPGKTFAALCALRCMQHKSLLLDGLTVLAKGTPMAQQERVNCIKLYVYGQAVRVPLAT